MSIRGWNLKEKRPGRRATGVVTGLAAGLAGAALLALAGCGQSAPPSPPPPTVTVAAPLVRPLVDTATYVGRFEAVQAVDLRPRVSGQIASVNFRDGDMVKAGQLLFRIDPRPFEAALNEAKAQLLRARAAEALAAENFRRTERMFKENAASRAEYDSARADRDSAKADVAAAEATVNSRALDLSFTRVTAPVSGRVSDRRLTTGNYVTAGTTLLTTIVSVDPIYFSFTGSEAFYLGYEGGAHGARMRGNPVDVRLQGEPDYLHKGRLDFVDNAIDSQSGTFRARAILPNPDGFLTPGLFGEIRVRGSSSHDALLVPDTALVSDQADKLLMVVGKDDTIVPHLVVTGPLHGNLREIRSGVAPTDRVVIDGVIHARPGLKVTVKKGTITPTESLPDAGSPPVTARVAG